jgi:thymidine phosphorylase
MAGNSLEVQEAVATLRGEGPRDLLDLCLALAEEALMAHGAPREEAEARARKVIDDGSALARFRAFVEAQGGDPTFVDHPERLDVAPGRVEITAPQDGFVAGVDALSVGRAVLALGGGRERKDEAIDHGVGVELVVKPGEPVRAGETVARLYHRDVGVERARTLVAGGLRFADAAPDVPPLVLGRVGPEDAV